MSSFNKIVTLGAALVMLGSTAVGTMTVGNITASADTTNNGSEKVDKDEYLSISNSEVLKVLKESNPEAYAKIPEAERSAMLRQDLLRQGGTYIKTNKNGFTVYFNSAIVKTAKIAGASAVAWAIASVAASGGLTAGPAAAISTALGGVIGSIPDGRGVWMKFSKKGSLVTWGLQ